MIKRTFDIVMSLTGLILLAPLFLVIAIFIKYDSSGDVFFRGVRVGKHGKPFRIYKFRSMKQDCEGKGNWNVGDNDSRITRMGHFLRKSKIDELPQLFNVLKGEMSLVGPRPELPYYVDMYTDKEKPILDMKPGITDWASMVNFEQFKDFTTAENPDSYYLSRIRPLKLKLQLYYRYNQNLISDMQCILWTVYKVLTRSEKLPRKIQVVVDDHYNAERSER